MPKEHGVPNGASLDTLTPARAELAQAISAVTTAVDLVERAQQPQDQLAIIMARAKIGEAEALEAELARLREHDNFVITRWVDGGAVGPRPQPCEETVAAERRYAEITSAARDAKGKFPAAQESLTDAIQCLRSATMNRDHAIFAASVEATEPEFTEFDISIARVLAIEVQLRSLVTALRQIGWISEDGSAALSAADCIERKIADARRRQLAPLNTETGRRLLDLLKTDPTATL